MLIQRALVAVPVQRLDDGPVQSFSGVVLRLFGCHGVTFYY